MLAFYLDHHVPSAITNGLVNRGIDVLTARQDDCDEQPDEYLFARSAETGRLLVTYERGFLRLARQWQRESRQFPGLVFGVQDRIDVGVAIQFLEAMSRNLDPLFVRNCVHYIPSHRTT